MKPVKIESGLISGMMMGDEKHPTYVYRGVPYAASTAGDNRWKGPQPVQPWQFIRECTEYMDATPQEPAGWPFPQNSRSEDCLGLNILTPTQDSRARLPVMVWLHGGGYFSGCGNNRMYSSTALAQHGVVQVSMNHRLGAMGMLAHPLLSKESESGVSGNYLFLDIIYSLKWVQRNIEAFGGDPDNITIFGESGGGGKVGVMMASPLAKGLFQKAICESGTAVIVPFAFSKPLAEIQESGEKIFHELGVDRSADPLKAVRALPWQAIIAAEQKVKANLPSLFKNLPGQLWDSAVDGWLLPKAPTDLFADGQFNSVPFIAGANLGELTSGRVVLPFLIPAYVHMAKANFKAGSPTYLYIFDQVPVGWRRQGLKSYHGMELHYLFNLPEYDWPGIFEHEYHPGAELSEVDWQIGQQMRSMWTQFAASGNPSVKGLIDWTVWTPKDKKYLFIADPLSIRSGFDEILSTL
jgi:para-nitrobenzyl esterase